MGALLVRSAIPLTALVFVVVNVLFMAHGHYWLNLLPALLLLGWLLFVATDKVVLFIAFATPLSINLEELEIGGLGISLPTEPLMAAIMLLFLLRLAMGGQMVDPRVLRHPITVLILLQLAWMAFTIVPSSMPVISFKAVVARCWFVVTAYFMAGRLFQHEEGQRRFIHAFLAGLVIVIVYTLIRHSTYDFAHDPGHWVMEPFFKDHTSYGAVLALLLPLAIAGMFMPGVTSGQRVAMVAVFTILLVGLIFSYTRAAWVSLAAAAALYLVMRLRIPVWVLALLLVSAAGVYWANEEQITIALQRNQEESSDDLGEHVRSISNISSDASNLERINRWNAALRMWEERPLTGWGPGTYMFQYAPFQAAKDRTIISTNFATGGNAHSEYLGPLSEQGLPGFLIMVALVATTLLMGIRLYHRIPPGADRTLLMALLLGLFTYYVHGVLNNYLDLDKASVPVWAFTAMLVMLDLKYPAGRANALSGTRT